MKASKKKSITVTVPVPQNMKTSERIPNHVLHNNEVLEIDDVNSKYDSDDQRILKILMAKCKVNIYENNSILLFVNLSIPPDDKGRHPRSA